MAKSELMNPKILVVIPVHNEEEFIRFTVDSLLSQSIAISQFVLVDDASKDRTPNILKEYADCYPEIKVVTIREQAARMPGAKVVSVFQRGMQEIELEDFDFVCKFDSDLIFPNDYFENVLQHFERDSKLGLVGGECVIEKEGSWKVEKVSKVDHVRGALKCYRKDAFKSINGLDLQMGWDSLDEYKLSFHGWDVKVISGLEVKHLRVTNRATSWRKIEKLNANMFYNQRFGLFIGSISALKRGVVHQPKFISGLYCLWSFYMNYITAPKPAVSKELGKYIRKYRRQRMFV